MDQKFKQAVAMVLRHEGGYVNNPDDPGGETKFGISKRSYPALDIKSLTVEEAVEIYRRYWWDKYRYGEIEDAAIAVKVFDMAVNMGPKRAHKILQLASNLTGGRLVSVDGVIGDLTLKAVNGHPAPGWLLSDICLFAVGHYAGTAKVNYLRGLVKRAVDLQS